MTLMDPETLAKVVEQAGGWAKMLADYRKLLELSTSPRAMFAIERGPGTQEWEDTIYLRGFNGGLEQASGCLDKVLGIGPLRVTVELHKAVTYKSEFGPHRITTVNPDGEWTDATIEDTAT